LHAPALVRSTRRQTLERLDAGGAIDRRAAASVNVQARGPAEGAAPALVASAASTADQRVS